MVKAWVYLQREKMYLAMPGLSIVFSIFQMVIATKLWQGRHHLCTFLSFPRQPSPFAFWPCLPHDIYRCSLVLGHHSQLGTDSPKIVETYIHHEVSLRQRHHTILDGTLTNINEPQAT